jgi:protein SCO1/2
VAPLVLRAVRIGSAFAILVLIGVVTIAGLQSQHGRLPVIDGIGGPFTLIDHRGKAVTERDYLGKPSLVFFGYTFCPDVCPTTLFALSNHLTELGRDGDRLNIVFITVDPERDTPDKLALYVSSFDERITGLSGTAEHIRAAMTAYRAVARKIPLADGDYAMDHTATIFMMNSKGQFVGFINYQEPEAGVRAKLRRLLDDGS